MNSTIKSIAAIIGAGIVVALIVVWVVVYKTPAPSTDTTSATFGSGTTRVNTSVTDTTGTNPDGTPVVTTGINPGTVFKIANGPVAGATLMLMSRPTTTVVRFVMQNSGHTFDLTLDSPGAATKAVSNTTIPGITHVAWTEQGRGAILQYLDGGVVKSAHFAFPATGSSTSAVKIQFLPNNISSLDVSPDGLNVAYLIKSSNGASAYTAKTDGAGSKNLFSLPFSQASIAWPSSNTLLAATAPAAGVKGVLYTIDAKTGSGGPVMFADGLTALADRTFAHLLYQIAGENSATYVQNIKTGLSTGLSFSPLPEQCLWSPRAVALIYCASPSSYVPGNYVDLWHMGTGSVADDIIAYDVARAKTTIIASPGGKDGGEVADVAELKLSPDDKYLIYIRKGDRSLWGVRLVAAPVVAQ